MNAWYVMLCLVVFRRACSSGKNGTTALSVFPPQ